MQAIHHILRHTLCALVLLAGLAPLITRAEPDACAPYRVAVPAPVDESARASAGAYQKGLLWKIERTGVAPSYLFGTIHLDDPRVTNLPSAVIRPLVESRSFTGEVILDPRAVAVYTQAMYFQDERTLRDLLPPPLFERTERLLADYGMPRGTAKRLKPWAAFTLLGRPKPSGDKTLDALLQDMAERQDMTLHGLETIEELVTALDATPLPDQVEILVDTICNRELIADQAAELTRRYLEHDLAGMVAVSRQYEAAEKRVYATFMKRVLTDRNGRMFERMLPRLQEGGAFIAVGALHLPGADGLLQRLEAEGYRVTPIH